MKESPEIIHVCTKGAVASDFDSGIIFGSPSPQNATGTIAYIRVDVARKAMEIGGCSGRLRRAFYGNTKGEG